MRVLWGVLFWLALAGVGLASSEQPIVIEARSLEADNKAGWVLFTGDVVAVKGKMHMSCDRMRVFTKKGKVVKIISYGNVKVVVDDKVVKAEKATYYADQDKVVFEGNPKVWQENNVVSGDVIVYYIKDGRTIVKTTHGDKVRAVIVPQEKENAEGRGAR